MESDDSDFETSQEAYLVFNNDSSSSADSISMNRSLDTEDFCGPSWEAFGSTYGSVHGYTSLILCLFGSLMNVLNLVVLTRRGMINPTNLILSALALADLLNMIEYIPFALFMKILARNGNRKTYEWALFVLIHSNFSQARGLAKLLSYLSNLNNEFTTTDIFQNTHKIQITKIRLFYMAEQ
jgi:hypothetical protein